MVPEESVKGNDEPKELRELHLSYSTGRVTSKHSPLLGALDTITTHEEQKILYNLIVLDPPFSCGMIIDFCHLAIKILFGWQYLLLK